MDTSKNNAHENEESSSRPLIFKYLPYWPLFLIFSALCAGGAYLYLWYATPLYQANATLIIKDQKKGYDDSKQTESLDPINTVKIIENEIEVIKSRTLMDNVVRNLHLYAPVYKEVKVKSVSAYLSSPVVIEASDPDSIIETPKIYLQYDKQSGTVKLDNKYTYRINEMVSTPYGRLKFLANPKYSNDNKDYPLYFSLLRPRKVAQKQLASLEASASNKLSSVINLVYTDEVPQKAEDVLNGLLASYQHAGLTEKNTLAKNTLAFVQDRLSITRRELDSIDRQIQQYRSGTNAVNLGSQSQLYLENVSSNDQKLNDVNNQLATLGEVEKFVRSTDNSSGIVPSTVGVSDPTLTELTKNLYNTQLEYNRLRRTVAENNPILLSMAEQINKIKPDIINNIESRRRSLEATRQNLNATIGSYNSVLQTIPAKEKELVEISRSQAIKNNIYQFLLQKQEESLLSTAGTDSDSRVVDQAQTMPIPVSPPKPLYIYLASIFLALLLTIGLVTARDGLNGKVLYRHELERLTSYPVIGEIAYKRTNNPIVIEAGKRTFIAEEFRKIRVALSFLGVGDNSKKILITSSIPGEGKSFISANLAVSLALTGKKVILIDLDMNNPVLSRTMGIEDTTSGISNYLTGEKEPEEIIKRVAVHENLFFVPAGTLPPGPAELLANGKVKDIIFYLENIFDFVIIDTAPVFAVTDTYLLSDYCDATLYVVRHNYTPKAIIKRIAENNKINPLTNPAIIFNGVKSRGFSKSTTNGYGYDYVYEYKQKPVKSKSLIGR